MEGEITRASCRIEWNLPGPHNRGLALSLQIGGMHTFTDI